MASCQTKFYFIYLSRQKAGWEQLLTGGSDDVIYLLACLLSKNGFIQLKEVKEKQTCVLFHMYPPAPSLSLN